MTRSGTAPAARKARVGGPTQATRPADDRLNDEIHALLRDAAEMRESRDKAQAADDETAAERQFDAVIAAARRRTPQARG